MTKILIIYPVGFKCQKKLDRKIDSIVSSISAPSFVYTSDGEGLIQTFCDARNYRAQKINEINSENFTHCIIFDDSETLEVEKEIIQLTNKPVRIVRVIITRVVNIRTDPVYNERNKRSYEYIGRGSYWGNPYVMHINGDDRDEVIRKFKYDFDNDKFATKNKSDVFKLYGKRLGCFCKPEACHGDILANFLNEWDDGK